MLPLPYPATFRLVFFFFLPRKKLHHPEFSSSFVLESYHRVDSLFLTNLLPFAGGKNRPAWYDGYSCAIGAIDNSGLSLSADVVKLNDAITKVAINNGIRYAIAADKSYNNATKYSLANTEAGEYFHNGLLHCSSYRCVLCQISSFSEIGEHHPLHGLYYCSRLVPFGYCHLERAKKIKNEKMTPILSTYSSTVVVLPSSIFVVRTQVLSN